MNGGQGKQELGYMVQNFSLPDLNGGSRSLCSYLDDKRGIVVVVWSGVCTHCVR